MFSRIVLPPGPLFDGLAIASAGVGAVVALLIARASIRSERSGTTP
jgi:hypothetical protein